MTLADFIETHQGRIIECWKGRVKARMSIAMDESQLINSLPLFLDDLVDTLRKPPEEWPALKSAEEHGRQRVQVGVDIVNLTQEMSAVGEAIVELARQESFDLSSEDIQRLLRAVGRGTALSARAYAALRDEQLANEASQHFSFVAHEIRNPLNSARLVSEILSIAPPEEHQGHLDRLQRALTRLSEQVDNSLIEARLYGKPRLELESVEANTLLDTVCDDVAAHVADRSITIRREIESFELEVDSKLIISALTNLLSNAVKFSCRGGEVVLQARTHEGRALFEVKDQCGGLPDGFQERLFQPFVQQNANKTGFGLGLAIVKQAAEAHGGAVRVSNYPGHGCRFVLDVPLRHSEAEDA